MSKPLNSKQRRILGYVAQGLTNVEAARLGGYSGGVAVSRLAHSDRGLAYLEKLGEEIDAEIVYSIQSRLGDLRNTASLLMSGDKPEKALACIKEANRLCHATTQ